MHTLVVKVTGDTLSFNNDLLKCASIIKNGGIGAFPTETVYGLGANALNESAVNKIFIAKGRPSDNPLIVHISNLNMLHDCVTHVDQNAKALIDAFWPGPLTIVFNKHYSIPNITSGGLSTIGIRFPSNNTALELIALCDCPIAAPSANISGKPSPTRLSHVEFDLMNKVDFIIGGEKSLYGLESTIIDCSKTVPTLLRPGSITVSMIEKVIEHIDIDPSLINLTCSKPLAPGMKYKHYSPVAKVILFTSSTSLLKEANNYIKRNVSIAIITENSLQYSSLNVLVLNINNGKNLYHNFRKCDFLKLNVILVEQPTNSPDNLAIINRLSKSADSII